MPRLDHLCKCFVFGGCPLANGERARSLSVVSALQVLPHWYHDQPPFGETGNFGVDLKLADAFRMLIHLEEPSAQLGWIERELKRDNAGIGWVRPYEAALISWWLDIFWIAQPADCLFEPPPCAFHAVPGDV